jgi:ribosomal protein L25 (general stress protein Ctc)
MKFMLLNFIFKKIPGIIYKTSKVPEKNFKLKHKNIFLLFFTFSIN